MQCSAVQVPTLDLVPSALKISETTDAESNPEYNSVYFIHTLGSIVSVGTVLYGRS